jgi:hypothetical protein
MAEEDSQERDITANRGRRCSRLDGASSAAGEQAGASAWAGVPVERSEPQIKTGWRELARDARYVYVRDELLEPRARRAKWYAPEHPERTVADGYEPRPAGRPQEGITGRREIVAALDGYADVVRYVIKDGVIRPKPSSWKRYRAGLGASAEGINTQSLADFFGVTPRTITEWRAKTSANALSSREADLEPATKADVDTLLERLDAIHGDVRTTLEVVLDVFGSQGTEPSSNPVIEAKIDLLVDSVLRDEALADAD